MDVIPYMAFLYLYEPQFTLRLRVGACVNEIRNMILLLWICLSYINKCTYVSHKVVRYNMVDTDRCNHYTGILLVYILPHFDMDLENTDLFLYTQIKKEYCLLANICLKIDLGGKKGSQ